MVNSVESYLTLNDTILSRIELTDDASLKKSQSIIKRIKKRDIYKFVNEVIIQRPESLEKEVKPFISNGSSRISPPMFQA